MTQAKDVEAGTRSIYSIICQQRIYSPQQLIHIPKCMPYSVLGAPLMEKIVMLFYTKLSFHWENEIIQGYTTSPNTRSPKQIKEKDFNPKERDQDNNYKNA